MRLRGLIMYYGGKGNLVTKLLDLVPPGGRPYVEPYFGGGSLFFAREPAPVEVINDLDQDIVTLMRAFQDRDQFEELRHRLMWTPYAREEFRRALEILNSPSSMNSPSSKGIERAWARFVTGNMGFSGVFKTSGNWSRTFVSSGGVAGNVNKWLMRLSMLDAFRWRLMHAQIDCRDALEVIRYWDNPEAVIYCDPPYHHDTRSEGHLSAYAYEQTHEHHVALVEVLLQCRGAVVLSGYNHPVYKPLEEAGWKRTDFQTSCYAAGRGRDSGLQGKGAATKKVPRVESAWQNPKAVELTAQSERPARRSEDVLSVLVGTETMFRP